MDDEVKKGKKSSIGYWGRDDGVSGGVDDEFVGMVET